MSDTINTDPPKYEWQSPKPQFDVGRVLGRTFSAVKNNFLSFGLLSLLIVGLPMFLIGLWPLLLTGGGGIMGNDEFNGAMMAGTIAGTVVGLVLYFVLSMLVQAVLIHACFKDFAGESVSVKDSMRSAFRVLLPITGLTVLYLLGVGLGFMLLVIPGIFLLLGWYICIPVLLVEKRGVTDSLSRSWELTKGYKRWVLLTFLILSIITGIISAVLSIAVVPFGDPNLAVFSGGSMTFWIVNAMSSALGQSIAIMISASAVAAIYYEIRDIKEGITPMSIASVFD